MPSLFLIYFVLLLFKQSFQLGVSALSLSSIFFFFTYLLLSVLTHSFFLLTFAYFFKEKRGQLVLLDTVHHFQHQLSHSSYTPTTGFDELVDSPCDLCREDVQQIFQKIDHLRFLSLPIIQSLAVYCVLGLFFCLQEF